MSSSKRITKELSELTQSPPEGISVSLSPSESLHTWHVKLDAPKESVYYPGRFAIVLTLPNDYPFRAPVVRFHTRIYHPNVTDDAVGGICLGLLKSENWKPSTKILAVLEALRNLLVEPQPDDPLEERIADEYRNDRPSFNKNVKIHVDRYASKEPEFPSGP